MIIVMMLSPFFGVYGIVLYWQIFAARIDETNNLLNNASTAINLESDLVLNFLFPYSIAARKVDIIFSGFFLAFTFVYIACVLHFHRKFAEETETSTEVIFKRKIDSLTDMQPRGDQDSIKAKNMSRELSYPEEMPPDDDVEVSDIKSTENMYHAALALRAKSLVYRARDRFLKCYSNYITSFSDAIYNMPISFLVLSLVYLVFQVTCYSIFQV